MTKINRLITFIVPLLAVAAPHKSSPAESAASAGDAGLCRGIEQVVEDYIRSRPEVIEQALIALQTKRQAAEKERVKAAINEQRNQLLADATSLVSGNPAADVTLVEFFDYRCVFCKKAHSTVAQLLKDDPRIRGVYKDLPVLDEESVFAAKAALAARAQGKHHALQEALLAAKTDLTPVQVMKIAGQVGLETKKLAAAMLDPALNAIIDRNRALAQAVGVAGTPAFVIGCELVPGGYQGNTTPTKPPVLTQATPYTCNEKTCLCNDAADCGRMGQAGVCTAGTFAESPAGSGKGVCAKKLV